MDAWLRETISELEGARHSLDSIAAKLAGEPDDAQLSEVWLSYVKVEKAVAFVKIELGSETPGRFVKLKPYAVPDERQALVFASRHLAKGLDELSLGNLGLALAPLRESRNYLRALLRSKRLLKVRKARSA